MKVQIFEPFFGRHHTKYVRFLLEALARMRAAGSVDEVVVSITREHRDSEYFSDQLAAFESHVTFDASVPTMVGRLGAVSLPG